MVLHIWIVYCSNAIFAAFVLFFHKYLTGIKYPEKNDCLINVYNPRLNFLPFLLSHTQQCINDQPVYAGKLFPCKNMRKPCRIIF